MADSLDAPKVFISYSWKPFTNKQKVLELAERLTNNRVHVILDDWDLKEGHDKYKFMEQMVNDPDVKRVLLICNKDYAEKANNRSGGVGVESMIVSNEIYSQADQTKFIPIVFEYDQEGKAYLPTFIKTRIYIDLSNEEVYEDNYESLMRNIFEKPTSKRPPLGAVPAYILDEDQVFLRTSNMVKGIKNALLQDKRNYQILINDYYSTFIEALSDFRINDSEVATVIDDVVITKIEALLPLRDDFVNFLEILFTYSTDFDIDKFIGFYEALARFIEDEDYRSNKSNYRRAINDHYRFFLYELFLYTTCIMVSKEKYSYLSTLLYTDFMVVSETTISLIAHDLIKLMIPCVIEMKDYSQEERV